jgi:hypothetical protein
VFSQAKNGFFLTSYFLRLFPVKKVSIKGEKWMNGKKKRGRDPFFAHAGL